MSDVTPAITAFDADAACAARDEIAEAREQLQEALQTLRRAEGLAREANLPAHIAGQLDQYTIRTIERFVACNDGDRHQPGNLADIEGRIGEALQEGAS